MASQQYYTVLSCSTYYSVTLQEHSSPHTMATVMVSCWGNKQIIEFIQRRENHQLFECKEHKVSLWWFLVIALLRLDIVAHTEPALQHHNIFRLNSQLCVWICQADCRAEKKSRGTGLSVCVCVCVSTPSHHLMSTAHSAFDRSLTFTGCIEFGLACALFEYPLPGRI